MALTAAQLLDELMGKDRNLVPGEKSAQVHWSHPDCCKNFLCGFCPHDLFVNTKADLGPCSKVHDDQLKADYESSSRYGRKGYEEEFIHFLSSIQSDVERKIRRGHERLLMNKAREQELSQNDNDKTKMMTDHINQLLEEIEQLGSEGKVEEAQGVAKLVEQLKEEREQSKANAGTAGQEKQMEVCEVCGAFLIVGDAQSRVDDHLQGKQHVGYAKIKSTLEDMKNKSWLKKRKESSEQDKGEPKKDERDRRSDRDSERDRGRRSRSRSRDRKREKRRSRERSDRDRSDRRDRDRDRRRSSRDRESRRSHRSRSRSPKERRRRSRSKDREDKRRRDSRDRRDGRHSRDVSETKDDRKTRELLEDKDKLRDKVKKDDDEKTNGETNLAEGTTEHEPRDETKTEVMETKGSDDDQ